MTHINSNALHAKAVRGTMVGTSVSFARYGGNRCDRRGLMATLPVPSGWRPTEFFDEPVSLGDAQRLHIFEFDQQLSRQFRIMPVALQLRDDLTLSANVLCASGDVIFGLCQMAQEEGSVHSQCYQVVSGFS